jgi:hypothetical protein
MTINYPTTKNTKEAIRQAIGQTVTFVLQGDARACSTCSGADLYDSVNDLSLNQFCPECSGAYWITDDVESGILAHVRWRTGDESDYGVAGEVLEGDCFITISIDSLSEAQIVKIKEVVADGRKLEVYRTTKRGAPTRDRYRFICREVGKE